MKSKLMSLTTPVVLIIFKRPDLTQLVLNAIREAQPKQLFVIADGPRSPDEAEKCHQAREIIEQIDWTCEVFKNYSDVNLGCRQRISSGLNWVFSIVEEAIILEDDCIPAPSFFPFCQTLLDYYRHDQRVMVISGDNFQNGQSRTHYSYYFSRYNHCWGWATWRRAWQYWEFSPEKWLEFKEAQLMEQVFTDQHELKYWTNIFDRLFLKGKPDSWAYAWTFACWSQSGLTILPNCNMVKNIGFGQDASNTRSTDDPDFGLKTQDIWQIDHPPFIIRHQEADQYTFDHHFKGLQMKRASTLHGKIRMNLGYAKYRLIKSLSFKTD